MRQEVGDSGHGQAPRRGCLLLIRSGPGSCTTTEGEPLFGISNICRTRSMLIRPAAETASLK